jgi:hypothetical protein
MGIGPGWLPGRLRRDGRRAAPAAITAAETTTVPPLVVSIRDLALASPVLRLALLELGRG